MTKPLLSEIAPHYDLIAIAIRVNEDADAPVEVLADAILETGWRHPFVMPVLLGCDLDDNAAANGPEEVRAHAGTRDWARAVLAVLLFSEWRWAVKGWCPQPWPLIRENAKNFSEKARWERIRALCEA